MANEEQAPKKKGLFDNLTKAMDTLKQPSPDPIAQDKGFTHTLLKDMGQGVSDVASDVGEGISDFASSGGTGIGNAVRGVANITDEYPNFWAGAAPLLAGVLSGDMEAGADIAGNTLLQVHKEAYDSQKAAAKASAKAKKDAESKSQKFTYLEDGSIRAGSFDPTSREYRDSQGVVRTDLQPKLSYQEKQNVRDESNRKLGKHFVLKKDDLGRMVKVDKRPGGGITVLSNTQGLAPVHKKEAEVAATKFNKSAEPIVSNIRELETGFQDLIAGNQLSNKIAVMRFIKEVETRLSDADRNYYSQEISDLKKGQERMRKFGGNVMNPRLIKDAIGLVSRSLGKSKKQYEDIRNTHSSQLGGRDFPKDRIQGVFGDMPSFRESIRMQGPDGTFDVPWSDVQEALDRGFKVRGRQ